MTYRQVRNERTGALVASRVGIASSLWDRMVGFLGRTSIGDEGLWFDRCSSIHMIGMRVALDIVFLDPTMRVVAIRERLRPMRVAWYPRACSILELAPGAARATGLRVGDRLRFGEPAE